jgi:hypothetical protein
VRLLPGGKRPKDNAGLRKKTRARTLFFEGGRDAVSALKEKAKNNIRNNSTIHRWCGGLSD